MMLKFITKTWCFEQDDQNALMWWSDWRRLLRCPEVLVDGEDGEFAVEVLDMDLGHPQSAYGIFVGTAHFGFHTGDVMNACLTFGVCLQHHYTMDKFESIFEISSAVSQQ